MAKKTKSLNIAYESDASQIKGDSCSNGNFEVLIPKSVAEISLAVKSHNNVVPRGAGTGLSGGAVPSGQDCIVIDMSKMNKILDFDIKHKKIVVQSGMILDELNGFLMQYGLEFPINPSSHSVCTIGGMIATDAVGNRAVKYGRTSKWVEWIEIVDNNGQVQKKSKVELSDFAGLEGITGIIVTACLDLVELKKRTAELFSTEKISDIIDKTRELKRNSSVSMIEFFNKSAAYILGFGEKYYLMIEYESEEGNITGQDYKNLINSRDTFGPTLSKHGHLYLEDPQIYLDKFEIIIDWFEKNKIPVFGHLGVGILHPRFTQEQVQAGKIDEMMKFILRNRGKVSGEHGIGLGKKKFLDVGTKKLYISVKKRNDPENKFNPGKII